MGIYKKEKILIINSVCGVGSTGKIVADLYQYLIGKGYECKVAYGRGRAKEVRQEDAIKIGSEMQTKIHAGLNRVTDRHGFYSQATTKRFVQWIEKYNPDIVHLHNIHGYYINIEILFRYLKEKNVPIIWTLHDCWAFTGHCAYFDYAKCNKWETGCYDCAAKREYPKSIFKDASSKNYILKKRIFSAIDNMTIVCPSQWLANLVKKSFLKKFPIQVINNGIDIDVFKSTKSTIYKKYGVQNKKIILGVANVWDRRKGLDDFLLLSQIIDEEWIIFLVGLDKKTIKKMPPNIIGIERTENVNELVKLYSAADIFLNLTHEDNYPTVNIEALACGTPVLTYNAGGSRESAFLEDNPIEIGDYQEIYRRIKTKDFSSVLVDRDIISKKYMVQAYEEIYQKL